MQTLPQCDSWWFHRLERHLVRKPARCALNKQIRHNTVCMAMFSVGRGRSFKVKAEEGFVLTRRNRKLLNKYRIWARTSSRRSLFFPYIAISRSRVAQLNTPEFRMRFKPLMKVAEEVELIRVQEVAIVANQRMTKRRIFQLSLFELPQVNILPFSGLSLAKGMYFDAMILLFSSSTFKRVSLRASRLLSKQWFSCTNSYFMPRADLRYL